jgi:hypothetical protein
MTGLTAKSGGMVVSVDVAKFQWYFMGLKSFGGILRRSQSFNATQPIFPIEYRSAFVITAATFFGQLG